MNKRWLVSMSAVTAVFTATIPFSHGATKNQKPAKKKTVGDLFQKIRSDATQAGKVNLAKSSRALPKSESGLRKVEKKNLQAIKPPKSLSFFKGENSDEARLEKLVDDEIAELFKLTRKYATSSNRGELWLRLAELYVEKARLVEFRIQNDYDKKINLWEKNKRKGPKPQLKLSYSNSFNLKAIQLYEWFVKDFPGDPRGDQAYFFLGYNFFELNNVKKGEEYYKILTSRYPNSPYVAESNFALGEFYFENEKWAEALKHYGKVIKEKESRVRSFAYYKAAWCDYRLGKVSTAMKILEYVIRMSRSADENSNQSRFKNVNKIRLAQEAMRDIVPFFAEIGEYTQAREYFKKVGGEKYFEEMLEKLGYIYSDLGKREAALHIFRDLQSMNPMSPKAFEYQYQVVLNFSAADNEAIFKRELFRWIQTYAPDSAWFKANQENKELIAKSNELREKTLRNYILQLHQQAQNTRLPDAQKKAREGYALYLKTFNEGPTLADMHFFYGELLFDLKEYENASVHYQWVVDNAAQSKYFEDAMLNTVLSIEKIMPTDEDLKAKAGDSLQPLQLGPLEMRFIKVATRYVESFPKSEKYVEIKFKIGRLYYSYNRFDEALPVFESIVKTHPKTQSAVYSANLILDIYNLKKDYVGLAKAGKDFMSTPALSQAGFDVDIKGIVEKAGFKMGQDLEVSKDYLGSAKAFDVFVQQNPKSSLVTSAQFNAAVNYERAGKMVSAIKMYEGISASSNKDAIPLKPKARKLLARLYERTGQFEKAALEFERFAKENPKDPLVPDFYFNAAVIWDGFNKVNPAIQSYEKFYETSRKADRTEAFFRIGEMQEREERRPGALKYYERYIQENPTNLEHIVEAHLRIAKLNRRKGSSQEADTWYQKTVAVQKRLSSRQKGVGAASAAEARFLLAQNTVNEFKSIRIPNDPSKQEAAVSKKLALLNRLNQELLEVIKYDDGRYIVASLSTLGMAYEHMSSALYNSPIPPGLTEEEKKLYQVEVDKIAAPLKQKAIDSYRGSIDKAYQINAYNDWTISARQGLSRYEPDRQFYKSESTFPVQMFDLMGL